MCARSTFPGRISCWFFGVLLLGASGSVGVLGSDQPAPKAILDAIKQEANQAYERLEQRRSVAKDDAAKKAAVDQYWREVSALGRRALALSRSSPDETEAVNSAIWVVLGMNNSYQGQMADVIEEAFGLLSDRWLKSEAIAPLCYYAAGYCLGSPSALRFLREAAKKSPHRLVRGFASLALGQYECKRIFLAHHLQDPIFSQGLRERWDSAPWVLDKLRSINRDESERLAELQFQRIVAEYPDVRLPYPYNQTPLGQMAAGELFKLRHLSIGKVAPEIEGTDVKGESLKLSDHRGKVVAIVFWATWCGPCMGMVPHEKEMVKRLEGKPFVLLGVNADADRGVARKAMVENGMTWRSWWDGKNPGPISGRWGVLSWPTVYILDPKGVIRYTNVRFNTMDQAVDLLIREAESGVKAFTSSRPRGEAR